MVKTISERTIGRLSLYRRLLDELRRDGVENVYSHQLAKSAGVTAAQIRRDLMVVGFAGSPTKGYDVLGLAESIGGFLDGPGGQKVALVGVGNLGRAILAYFAGRRRNLSIVAGFDRDPNRVGRVIHGCRCYPMDDMPRIVAAQNITVGVLAVPAMEAQTVADQLIAAGVQGLLNFAPAPLRVPAGRYVEDVDITTSLEKVAYFARQEAS